METQYTDPGKQNAANYIRQLTEKLTKWRAGLAAMPTDQQNSPAGVYLRQAIAVVEDVIKDYQRVLDAPSVRNVPPRDPPPRPRRTF